MRHNTTSIQDDLLQRCSPCLSMWCGQVVCITSKANKKMVANLSPMINCNSVDLVFPMCRSCVHDTTHKVIADEVCVSVCQLDVMQQEVQV